MALHIARVGGQHAPFFSSQRPARHGVLPTAKTSSAARSAVLKTQLPAASKSCGVDRRRCAVVFLAAAAAPSAAPEKTQDLAEFDVAQTILLQVRAPV